MRRRTPEGPAEDVQAADDQRRWGLLRLFAAGRWAFDPPLPASHPRARFGQAVRDLAFDGAGDRSPRAVARVVTTAERLLTDLGLTTQFETFAGRVEAKG